MLRLWAWRRWSGNEAEATDAEPSEDERGNRKDYGADVHSRLPVSSEARPENIDVNESSGVVSKEGAKSREYRAQQSQENGTHNLGSGAGGGTMAVYRNHAVINEDGIGWIQMSV